MIATMMLMGVLAQAAAQPAPVSDAARAYEEGNAAFEKRENDTALAAYDRAIALEPKRAEFHVARCRTLARVARHDDAVASCSTAITLRPEDPVAYIERGHFYVNLRKLDLALADLTRPDVMKTDANAMWYHLALAQYLKGEYAKAADTYNDCVRTATAERTGCLAWQYLALSRAGRQADARKLLDTFVPDPAAPPSGYIDRLLLFKGVKSEEEVAKTMEKDALQLPTVAYSIGMWHLLNGREQKAREYFDKALTPPAQQTAFGAVASYYERQRMKR